MSAANFSGPAYDPKRDQARLGKQHERVAHLMSDGNWRTVKQIAAATRDPENSVQAQLRHLRKPRFGGYIVSKRTNDGGLWEYNVRRRRFDDPPYQGGRSTKAMGERVEKLETLLEKALKQLESSDLFSLSVAKQIRSEL